MMTIKEVPIKQFPKCNVSGCEEDAHYDTPTKLGPWAYLCEEHFKERSRYGGSKFVLIQKKEAKVLEGTPRVHLMYEMDDYVDVVASVRCPACRQDRNVEPDANYEVTCDACGQIYRCVSMF